MKLLRRIGYLLRQREIEAELAEEIEHHRLMNAETSSAENSSPENSSPENSSDAAHAMGNITRAREDARAVWIWPWLESIWQDIAYALRSLRRQPGFTAVALLTLGTAIGLNTSFFTVFNAIALRPWPVKDPARVVKILSFGPRRSLADSLGGIGVAEYRYFAQHARSFSGLAIMHGEAVRLGFEPFGKSSQAVFVGGDHFRVLGVEMQLGRGFLPEEDRMGSSEAVAVLSYPYWRDHFSSDPAIVGKQMSINEQLFTVVGVTPEDFTGTSGGGGRQDVFLPLSSLPLLHPAESWVQNLLSKPGDCCEFVAGRLAPGASRAQAVAELEVLDRQFRAQFGLPGELSFLLPGSTVLDNPGSKFRGSPVLVLLFAGVTLVVLLACANVGNLLIARAGARRKEIEIRRAIGAGRGRIIRQLMTEGLVLALGAAALGVLMAYRLPLFVIAQTGEIPPLRLTPDGTVLAYAVSLAVVACLCFGLAPALHGTRNSGSSRLPLRNFLLAAQVALSVILLIGAGLALEGVAHLRGQDPGFAIAGVSVVSFELPAASLGSAGTEAFDRQLLRSLEDGAVPFGVTAREPLSTSRWMTDFLPSGQSQNQYRAIEYQEVTGGYFDVLKLPVIAGRNFTPGDIGKNVILVNQTLARLYWNNQSPVGQTIVSHKLTHEIVGVVKDAYTGNLDKIDPLFYVPFTGSAVPKVLVSPAAAQAVAAIASRIEPGARTQALPLQANVERWFSVARIGAEIAGMLGVFALILATVGMSGVFAYVVQQRTKEIGIRMALGARPAQVVRLVLGGSSRAVVIGLGCGLAIALLASRFMRAVLYGVNPLNPIAYLAVGCVLAAAGLAASYAPARRATRVDPLQALRHD